VPPVLNIRGGSPARGHRAGSPERRGSLGARARAARDGGADTRLAAACDDEDGGSGGGTRGRQRRGRAAVAGGWRGPGKRRRWPTSRLPFGTR